MNSMYLVDQKIAQNVRKKNEARAKRILATSICHSAKTSKHNIDIDLIKKKLLETEAERTNSQNEKIIEIISQLE